MPGSSPKDRVIKPYKTLLGRKGDAMSDLQSFPIDKLNANSTIGTAQEESGLSRRFEKAKEKGENVEPESIEDRVQITPNALKQSETADKSRGAISQPGLVRTDELSGKSYGQTSSQAQSVSEQRRDQEKAVERGFQQGNIKTQPVVTNQASAASPSEQRAETSAALEAGFKIGNNQTDPTATQKFSTRNQNDGAGAPTVVQQRLDMKEQLLEGKDNPTALETERGQNVSKMI